MQPPNSVANPWCTICSMQDLKLPQRAAVTHVLSLIDPDCSVPEIMFGASPKGSTVLQFNDIISHQLGSVPPRPEHIEAILRVGNSIRNDGGHLLIHCHAGVSRSTAAAAILMAQNSRQSGDELFAQLLRLRPQAWPNSLMVRIGDDLLGRGGTLLKALGKFYARQLKDVPERERLMKLNGRAEEVEMGQRSEPLV
jgi:predicted protein tyrosine phosphatase